LRKLTRKAHLEDTHHRHPAIQGVDASWNGDGGRAADESS